MKLGEVIPKYREYRQVLVDQTRSLAKQRDEAQKKFELAGDKKVEELYSFPWKHRTKSLRKTRKYLMD